MYELVASDGPIHEPMFEFSVKAREYSAKGKGCDFCVKYILMTLFVYCVRIGLIIIGACHIVNEVRNG